ncbi:pentapeptide repeat-containing protein [Microcoleus sp. SVA1_B3]|uniref:pentapeptide repeat-containing protein n=1 Tax=Microcoleus sp. SVA1_B3 TaxID=2818950 RepID=UPI002FCF7186
MPHASLANADLQGADLRGSNFREANLSGLLGGKLIYLQGANLNEANLIQSPFDGANLKNAKVAGVISVEGSIK